MRTIEEVYTEGTTLLSYHYYWHEYYGHDIVTSGFMALIVLSMRLTSGYILIELVLDEYIYIY